MKSIVAVDKNWGIGKGGGLLVHLPGDLKYFKEKTLGKVVIMGRTTFESLPGQKPLPGRVNIVLSRNPDFQREDCILCRSTEELFKVLENYNRDDVMVIGGEEIYKLLFPYCDSHLVTKIDGVYEADCTFENLDLREDLELVFEGEARTEKGIVYKYTEYRRK